MPLSQDDAAELIKRRHPEWAEHQKRWRWLQDSLEGGERYRHADYFRGPFDPPASPWYAYGFDSQTGEGYPFSFGQIVERNLVPHTSEMSPQNRDLYALRLNRTAVPALVSRIVRRYLSRIYSRPVARKGPPQVAAWWGDTDGCGKPINLWVRKTVGPLLLTLGQLDLVFAPPETPDGVEVKTRAQLRKLGLDGVVAGYILPENLVWWSLDRKGRYGECLVFERCDDGAAHWRHWTAEGVDVYTADGDHVPAKSYAYGYGRPPVVRVFDDKKLRCRNTGQSRMEVIADLQKSIYNRRSELILGDVIQSHAVLQGPEEFMEADAKVPLGPGGALPKKRRTDGGYEKWEYVDKPQTGAEACRTHVQDDLDEVLADAALLKPAGTTEGKTVAQSGVSKSFDVREGNDVLSEVAATLRDAEVSAARMALLVATDGRVSDADLAAIAVDYPREYDLFSAQDLATVLADVQAIAASAGLLPETESEDLKRLIAVLLPGLDEPRMAELHTEIVDAVRSKAARRDQEQEAAVAGGGSADGADSTEDPAIGLPADVSQQVSAVNAIMSPSLD